MGSKKAKKLKKKKNEDRISDFPDALIQHILSFLPSTKQSIQTSVLSKRWRNQWTRVPVLIFDCDNGMTRKNFLEFIDNTLLLHNCSKIYKFHIRYPCCDETDLRFAEKIAFANRKYVEDLNLDCIEELLLPEFLFNNDSLLKLTTNNCSFMPKGKVNWGCLSSLEIEYCNLPYQALEHIVFGSPSLKSLKLDGCAPEKIVIASKSLKKLFIHHCMGRISVLEISCPTLEELSLRALAVNDPQLLFSQAIQNVLSISSSLESFEIISCNMCDPQFVIASKSLKKLVLNSASYISFGIEISCPQLEELKLLGTLNLNDAKLLNLASLLRATIDFKHCGEQKTCKSFITEILQQLQHLKELKIGTSFLEIVSTIQVGAQFSPVLSIKCLTLDPPYFVKQRCGVAHLLRISPVLENLVINVPRYSKVNRRRNSGKNYWDSNVVVYDCLVSHLKTIKIMGFPEEGSRREHILNLVKFLLKNARVLEKMVVILEDHNGTSQSDPSRILLSLPRCSPNAVIEVLWSDSKRK